MQQVQEVEERRGRRTQAERSEEMRARVLDAALDCLADLGYAATTTTVVAERAGVSRGAQLHHFPTRAALVAGAVERLFAGLTDQYQKGFARLARRSDRLGAAVELLWSMYKEPRYVAVHELYTAARTDPDLLAHIAPVAARHQENVFRLARQYYPAAAKRKDFVSTLQLILDAMQGMAVARYLGGALPDESLRLQRLTGLAAQVTDDGGL